MGARLAYSVIVDGNVVVAGTEQTPELKKRIGNPEAWEDDDGEAAVGASGESKPRQGSNRKG